MIGTKLVPLSSSELGNLWQAYQERSMKLLVLKHFIHVSKDKDALAVLQKALKIEEKNQKKIEHIFVSEAVAMPIAFTNNDLDSQAPGLFDDPFHLMFFRLLSKTLIGLYALHSGMSYREDIYKLYYDFTADSQEIFYSREGTCR